MPLPLVAARADPPEMLRHVASQLLFEPKFRFGRPFR